MLKFGACRTTGSIQLHRDPPVKFNIGVMGKCQKYLHDLSQTFTDIRA
jgi:hypothetical protein